MIQAIIEIGTNSMKFCLAKGDNQAVNFFYEDIAFTRIGENIRKKKFIEPEIIHRNIIAIETFVTEANKHQAEKIAIIATQALREAENSAEFIETVKEKTDISLVILSGKEEAKYSSLAATKKLKIDTKNALFFDIGGGSTELFCGNDMFASIPMGVVSMTEQFGKELENNELHSIKKYMKHQFQKYPLPCEVKQLIGIGGTVVTMQKVNSFLNENRISEKLTEEDVNKQINYYAKHSPHELVEKIGLPLRRADVIYAGALLVQELLNVYKMKEIKVCNYGVRHGYLLQMLEEK